jgi:hypothetical protein
LNRLFDLLNAHGYRIYCDGQLQQLPNLRYPREACSPRRSLGEGGSLRQIQRGDVDPVDVSPSVAGLCGNGDRVPNHVVKSLAVARKGLLPTPKTALDM